MMTGKSGIGGGVSDDANFGVRCGESIELLRVLTHREGAKIEVVVGKSSIETYLRLEPVAVRVMETHKSHRTLSHLSS